MDQFNNIPALIQIMAWCQGVIWTNDDVVYWQIYAALGEDELAQSTGIHQSPIYINIVV